MIELHKLSNQNRRFGFKLFISYIAFSILMLISITIIHMYFSDEQKIHKFEREASLQASEKKFQFDNYFEKRGDSLRALVKNEYFSKYIESANYGYYIDLLFLTIMEANKDYMQVRYIDKNGSEKIRIERSSYNSDPILIQNDKLQNKSNRYYFKEIMAAKHSGVWYSHIDLNIEHSKIEVPIKPVLRMGVPVFNKNEKIGFIIVNIFMENVLNHISNSTLYNIYLIDKQGNFILHPDKQLNWNKYLDTNYSLKKHFMNSYEKILENDEYIDERFYSKLLGLNNDEGIKMIVEPKFFIEQEKIIDEIFKSIYIMSLIILGSFPFAYFFSSKFNALKEEVMVLNLSLKEKVKEKTKELQDLNENLEDKVKEEVDKNTEKEKQLQYQNRLAQMGEMIAMIAHQWRQPLSAISAITGALKLDIIMDNYKKDFFEESIDKVSSYSQHLSHTINDFRNFFSNDKELVEVTPEEMIENSLGIIDISLENNNIELNKDYTCNEKINCYANEIKQVILNIIKNAEDVIVENSIENPLITFKTYKIEQSYFIEIGDNAGGILGENLNDIFMPYFSTKKNKDGTGLGLYMSKTIIEEHCKGKLWAKNLSQGALFTIELRSL